jgi:hypothetical protein
MPIFTYPLALTVKESRNYTTAAGKLLEDQPLLSEGETAEQFSYVLEQFSDLNAKWQNAIKYKLERSQWMSDEEENTDTRVEITRPAEISAPVKPGQQPKASIEDGEVVV